MMNKRNLTTGILSIAAAGLLAFSALGGTRAALTYYSETYDAQFSMQDIGVTLNENGAAVSHRDYEAQRAADNESDENWNEIQDGALLADMIPDKEGLKLGYPYKEELTVSNTGTIDEYVRVSVYAYFTDKDGNKNTTLDPDLIQIGFTKSDKWIADKDATTKERTIMYYTDILEDGATTVDPFVDTITLSPELAKNAKVETVKDKDGTVRTTYTYDGFSFVLEAKADAVQTHNAADAIKSAWGTDVEVSADGTLTAVR